MFADHKMPKSILHFVGFDKAYWFIKKGNDIDLKDIFTDMEVSCELLEYSEYLNNKNDPLWLKTHDDYVNAFQSNAFMENTK